MSNKLSAKDVEIGRRMRAAGIPGEMPVIDPALVIRQDGGAFANSVATSYLTSECMGSIIQAYIKVICKQSAPFMLCGFELRLPWKDTPAVLLPDPANFDAPQIYRFPGYSAAQFDKGEVIVQSNRTLRRGHLVEGYLLAADSDRVPPGIQQGARVVATLTITDQFGEGHDNDLILRVDRSAEWQSKPKAHKPLRGLFDRPDKVGGKLHRDAEAVVEEELEILQRAGVAK